MQKNENINNNNNNNKIKSPKKIIFEEEKIYIKYEEDDYVNKIWIFNQKNEKKNYKRHNRGKYLSRLRKNEKLKSIILNCPIIDYEKIKKKNMLELNNDKNNKENNQQKIKNTKKRISNSVKTHKIHIQNKGFIENINNIKDAKSIIKDNKNNIKENINNIKDNKKIIKDNKNNIKENINNIKDDKNIIKDNKNNIKENKNYY